MSVAVTPTGPRVHSTHGDRLNHEFAYCSSAAGHPLGYIRRRADPDPAPDARPSGCAGHFAVNSWFSLSPRIEVYDDKDGFITGAKQRLKEFTMTAEVKMQKGFLTRLEYRRDWSDTRYFDRGNGNHKNMNTLLVGFVVYFGPK